MTPAEIRESKWLGAAFGIWNAATCFAPVWIMFFMAPPLNNWKLALAAVVLGFSFYPFWFKLMAKSACSTQWARAQGITPESLKRYSFAGRNIFVAALPRRIAAACCAGNDVLCRSRPPK